MKNENYSRVLFLVEAGLLFFFLHFSVHLRDEYSTTTSERV